MNHMDINKWLEEELGRLDISPTNYQKAVDRYNSVGRMIESKLRDEYGIECHVYPQGSFMLGTVVKPYGKDKEYDVDLVCNCSFEKQQITPKQLKELIGKIINEDGIYGKMLGDEGRRTWTIEYAEDNELSFHIDIQPSILNKESHYEKAILTTTKSKKNTDNYLWDNGNPLGLKDWFNTINSSSYDSIALIQKRALFEKNSFIYASIDDIPKQLVVTKLQRLIQVLKRHRDIRFENQKHKTDKPNSMIITILAAKVYEEVNQSCSLIELLKIFSDKVSANLEFLNKGEYDVSGLLIDRINGKYEINNPTVEENLAERWNDFDNDKKKAFYDWSKWLLSDIDKLLNSKILSEYETRTFDSVLKDITLFPIENKPGKCEEPKELVNTPQPWKKNV